MKEHGVGVKIFLICHAIFNEISQWGNCIPMDISFYPKYLIRSILSHRKHRFFKEGYEFLHPDFSRHGMSAWQHYVLDGRRKGYGDGSHPDADQFFAEGYLEMYQDIAQSGMDPWHHYILKGRNEGRDNGLHPKYEEFFAEGYLEMYPDVADNGMEPWHHYVLVGKKEGRDNGWHPDEDKFFGEGYLEMYPDVAESGIEPWHHYVMAGKKEGRDSGLHPNGEQFFPEGYLVLYPDAAAGSMDPWHHYVLKGKKEGRCDGLHPGEELFSSACYLEMYPDVAENGMDPWIHYVIEGRKEGRINPVSQLGPTFSPYFYQSYYPDANHEPAGPWLHFCKKLGEGEDRYPNKIVMKEKESQFIPYSCRGVKDINSEISDCLGRFDLHTLVDFMKLKECSDAKGNPAPTVSDQGGGWERTAALFADDHVRKIVYFSHNQGGGATMYKDQKVREYTREGCLVLTVIYEPAGSDFILYVNTREGCCSFDHADLRLLLWLGLRNVETIFINSLNGYPKEGEWAYSVADLIIGLKKATGARLVYLCHDFEFACPRINCLNDENKFCGLVQSETDCGVCASQSTCMGISQYRAMYGRLLQACDEYVFFSHDTLDSFSQVYQLDPDKAKVIPHSPLHEYSGAGQWSYDPARPFARFTVLIPGVIALHKGSEYVRDFAELLNKTHPDARIVVMGCYTEAERTPNIVETGPYDSARLPELMRIFEPNCAVFPSICPETFSYTVHELMEFGLPVISFNVGAQAEALKAYRRGIVLPQMSAECLHRAVSRLYDLSSPHKLSNCLEQYSVTFGELQFFNSRRVKSKSENSRDSVSICVSVANEKEDYASILSWLQNITDPACAGDRLRICFLVSEKLFDGFRDSETVRNYSGRDFEVIQTNGCGALKLLRDCHLDGTVIYLEAFSESVSELEKYYILTSLFGKSGERIAEISSAVSGQDSVVYLDNFYHITDRAIEARKKQDDSYLQARRAYLAQGSFELFLDRTDRRICSYRNVLAFSAGLLGEVSGMIQDQRFFTDCPDSVVFDLALNDLSLRSRYRYLKLIPDEVAREHLSSQRELFRHLALANFNPAFYLEKYDDVRRSAGDPLSHFLGHGFEENRLYADFVSDEWLGEHYRDIDEAEKYYLMSYKSYAEARYIYGMPLADFRKYIGVPAHYVESPSDCLRAGADFSSIKVSFIVPVYNSARFLRHCLDSIYNVDYPNFEVILVDDGSKDNSVEIINEYKERYSSITKVIIHPENLCFAATHKDGINAATGKYFSIIDADDYISEDYAKVFVAFSEAYHLDMAVCDWTRPKAVTAFYAKNRYLIDPVVATAGELQDSFGNWNNPQIPNIHYGLNRKIYNRESFIQANPITINPDYAYNEDFSVTLKLSENTDLNIGLIKNRLYGWFDNPDSVSYCDMTETVIVHFVYTFFVDLKEFMQNEKYSVRMISYCRKQLYEKLECIENKVLLKKRLEFLASQLDQHIDMINSLPYMVNNYLKGMFNHLYFRTIKSVKAEYKKVCVLDTVGHYELKKFLLPKLRQEKIDFYYASCSPEESFAAMMDKLTKVNKCCLIITDGGWAWSEMVTDLPIINTWHGMGALKYTSLFPGHLQPDIGFSSGKNVNFCYRWFYNLPDSRIVPNGNLLASRYLHADFRDACREQFFAKHPDFRNKRIYLYAPTFRGYEPNFSTMKPGYDWDKVSDQLKDDEVILVKWHPCLKFFSPEVLPDLSKYKNIIDVTDYDLSEVLLSSSVLLTDYSSVIFYAAVIDMPIGILATDLDSYAANRGFFIDYRSEAPCEVFEETDAARLLVYIRSRRSDTRKYKEFKERHVGGVTDNVDEILSGLIRKYLRGRLKLF